MIKRLIVIATCICFLGMTQISLAGVDWALKKQFNLETAPLDTVLSPDGKWMFVLTSGEVLVYEIREAKIINRIPVEGDFDRISYSAGDNTLLVSSRSGKKIQLIGIEAYYPFSVTGLPFKGLENAPVTLVVFSSYQCAYCARLEPLLDQLLEKYTKELKVVIKNFPLSDHPFADKPAMAALAAKRQGRFWEYHQRLFQSMSSLSDAKIQEIARDLGLDMERFNRDLNDSSLQALIERDHAEGVQAEVQGTPAFFINGKPLKNRSIEGFHQMIEKEMRKSKTTKAGQFPGGAETRAVKTVQASEAADARNVEPLQSETAMKTGRAGVLEPGDSADLQYICRLKNGEIAASTENVDEAEQKSNIFVARKQTGSLAIVAIKPGEPLPERPFPKPFEVEIGERLARMVTGMKEGEKRQVELTAQMIPPMDEQSGFVRLSRVRTRPKKMKMPRSEYELRARKAPEVGQVFFIDPAFKGKVESVSEEEVVIRFERPGDVVETPFGKGYVREEGEDYKVEIDAREGSLVRTANTIGRIIAVTDKIITIDRRHPFGYETLICDVTVSRIKKAEANEDKTAKWSMPMSWGNQ